MKSARAGTAEATGWAVLQHLRTHAVVDHVRNELRHNDVSVQHEELSGEGRVHVGSHLHVRLRLYVAAHVREGGEHLPAHRDHGRDDGVVRTLRRESEGQRVRVRVRVRDR